VIDNLRGIVTYGDRKKAKLNMPAAVATGGGHYTELMFS